MSAAIQLVPSQLIQPEKAVAEIDSLTPGSPEQKLRRALDYIQELQGDVRNLQNELARAERALIQKDTLLRNATLREQELRAGLVKGVF